MWVGMSSIRDSLCSVCIQVVVTLGRMERGYLPGCVKLATDPAGEVGTQSKRKIIIISTESFVTLGGTTPFITHYAVFISGPSGRRSPGEIGD